MTRAPNAAQLLRGTLFMCGVVLIWGTFLPVAKYVLNMIDPYYLTMLRYGAAALAFLALTVAIEGRASLSPEGKSRLLFFYGTAGYCGFSLFVFEGTKLSRPEHGAMILALVPVWVTIYQWLHTGQRPRTVTLSCIGLALGGMALVVTRGDLSRLAGGGDLLGNFLTLLASIFWTIYTLGAQRVPGWSPLRYSALCAAFGFVSIAAATAVATALGHARPPALADVTGIGWSLAYVVLVVSILAMLLWNTAVSLIGPLNASLIANFAPVITFAIAVMQGQSLAGMEVIGAVLVLVALIANNLANRRIAARAVAVVEKAGA